jgi:hypothetical protein
MNRDTLYSQALFDLDAGPMTITLPDAGKRFISMQIINEETCRCRATRVLLVPRTDFAWRLRLLIRRSPSAAPIIKIVSVRARRASQWHGHWRANEIAMRHARRLSGTLVIPLLAGATLLASALTAILLSLG